MSSIIGFWLHASASRFWIEASDFQLQGFVLLGLWPPVSSILLLTPGSDHLVSGLRFSFLCFHPGPGGIEIEVWKVLEASWNV